jgi:hypothetical protein
MSITRKDLPEFRGQIADIFEDFCTDHNIVIDNPKRGPDNKSVNITGDDYNLIINEVTFAVDRYKLYDNVLSDKDMASVTASIMDAFKHIVKQKGYLSHNSTDLTKTPDSDITANITVNANVDRLTEKIINTFVNWGVYKI